MRFVDVSTPVTILNVATHGSLGMLRSLGRLGVPMYAVHSARGGPAVGSRYIRRRFTWDLQDTAPDIAVQRLLDIGRLIGRRSILIPTCDPTTQFVADYAEALSQWFLFPHRSAESIRSLCSKREMYFLAKRCGVPTPEAAFPTTRSEVEQFLATARFPVMLKGIDGSRLTRRTGKTMVIVHSARELLASYDQMEDPANPNLMLQEYIPGGDDTVWMFNGYFNVASDCLVGFTGKKIRQNPVYTGITSLGICTHNETVDQTTRRFMKAIGYRGILDIGYRYDGRDGQYKVLDINPRIGATFRLFLACNGLDVLRAMYLDFTGQPVPVSPAREGRKWMVELPDLVSCLDYHRDSKLTFSQWLKSLRGIEETGYFAWDDPLPFIRLFTDGIARKIRRFTEHRSSHSEISAEPSASAEAVAMERRAS